MDKSPCLLLHSTTLLPISVIMHTNSLEHTLGLVRPTEHGVMQSQPVMVSKLSHLIKV